MSNFRVGQNLLFAAVLKVVLIITGKQVFLSLSCIKFSLKKFFWPEFADVLCRGGGGVSMHLFNKTNKRLKHPPPRVSRCKEFKKLHGHATTVSRWGASPSFSTSRAVASFWFFAGWRGALVEARQSPLSLRGYALHQWCRRRQEAARSLLERRVPCPRLGAMP